jgi:hypothetical protein
VVVLVTVLLDEFTITETASVMAVVPRLKVKVYTIGLFINEKLTSLYCVGNVWLNVASSYTAFPVTII